MLALTILGNVVIAAIFLALSSNQLTQQQAANLDTSAMVYQQAWNTASSEWYEESIGSWHPQTGSPEKRPIWDAGQGFSFQDNFELNDAGINPLYAAIVEKNSEDIENVLTELFGEEIDNMDLSFVYLIDSKNQILHCITSFDDYGIDPCDSGAVPSFNDSTQASEQTSIGTKMASRVPVRRGILRVDDSNGELESSIHQVLYVDIRDQGTTSGTVVLGKNLFEALESFEYEFEVKAVLSFDKRLIELNNYYEIDNYSGISDDADIIEAADASLNDNLQTLLVTGTFGAMNERLAASVFGFPISNFAKVEDALLLVMRDQRAVIEMRDASTRSTLFLGLAVFALVLMLVAVLTTYAFDGIKRAINVLQALVQGDHSVSIPEGRRFLRSDNDEIALLSNALQSYRAHLIEMDTIKARQEEKRRERDGAIIEKMGLLADQLEGDARKLILSDIERMESLSREDKDSDLEDASLELMSMAFSRMSHEVTALLDARTKEMQEAYEQASAANREIQSSINYAAKLQRALLRAEEFPDDFKIDLTWRPRDIVGGDIYVVRTTENKTVIAVIDCTGHGVPGAFTSVIARAVVDRAIEDPEISTAGEYLTASNRLIKDMLFQNESGHTDSDAGFDGTICILDRETGRLEFAGANSSLFVLNNNTVREYKGDKKSVGAIRTTREFQFSTEVIQNPRGMFVMLTDGVTDVMNENIRPMAFGRKRLIRLLEQLETSDPKYLVSKVMEAVDEYKGGTPLRDDLTLLAFFIDSLSAAGVGDFRLASSE